MSKISGCTWITKFLEALGIKNGSLSSSPRLNLHLNQSIISFLRRAMNLIKPKQANNIA